MALVIWSCSVVGAGGCVGPILLLLQGVGFSAGGMQGPTKLKYPLSAPKQGVRGGWQVPLGWSDLHLYHQTLMLQESLKHNQTPRKQQKVQTKPWAN